MCVHTYYTYIYIYIYIYVIVIIIITIIIMCICLRCSLLRQKDSKTSIRGDAAVARHEGAFWVFITGVCRGLG